MSFHVYIERELEHMLDDLCRKSGRKRNSLVREALREYLERRTEKSWPDEVFSFKPDRQLDRFELRRNDLVADRDDLFAGAE